MGSKITFSRFVGLVFLAAALTGGTANAMSVGGTTPQGLKADGLRLQGVADRYVEMRGYTQDGLNADGLRLQAMARAYTNRPAASFYTPRQPKIEAMRSRRKSSETTASTGVPLGSARSACSSPCCARRC